MLQKTAVRSQNHLVIFNKCIYNKQCTFKFSSRLNLSQFFILIQTKKSETIINWPKLNLPKAGAVIRFVWRLYIYNFYTTWPVIKKKKKNRYPKRPINECVPPQYPHTHTARRTHTVQRTRTFIAHIRVWNSKNVG